MEKLTPAEIIWLILVAFFLVCVVVTTPRAQTANEIAFTFEEVKRHNKSEDCWVVVDGLIFDLTVMSAQHPSLFACGEDVSENYHRNHGPAIRNQMMEFYIGELMGDAQELQEETLSVEPHTEMFATAGWNPRDLMVVIERENRSLLFIDTSTHTPVARMHDLGFQPHTAAFSPDAKYGYLISRDGYLTKFSLETLEPLKSVRVGINSRGTALTESGMYLAIGNYEPQNVVLLDTRTLEIIKTYDLVDVREGNIKRSRAGALVEKDELIIVALKDLGSVWVIDTQQQGFPVSKMFWDVGGQELHDAYLTPDASHFIVAVQDASQVFVLDTLTLEKVAVVPTGLKPHTGPGATYQDMTFIPSLGEGSITVINTTSWTSLASIKTGGPGLFVRHSPDPTYHYIWADTAFGENEDEIYVIDARTLKIVETLIPDPDNRTIHPEFTQDANYVYVLSWLGNKIFVYDAHTFKQVAIIPSITPSGAYQVGVRIDEKGL